ncbi:hypothetical protein [Streptomyces sp. NPDC095602]|uniref:hypothetical protein n=1 Tax=Streptomyces sp. NPDC095602 TaxID=3155819 RepID=UPI003328F801
MTETTTPIEQPATQLRLVSSCIVAAANEAVRTDAVRSIRVLAVGAAAVPRHAAQAPADAPDAFPARLKTREMASPGFHAALAAHQEVAASRRVDPSITKAVERQTAAMRELSRRAFPSRPTAWCRTMPRPRSSRPARCGAARPQRPRPPLRRARAERSGLQVAAPQRFGKTA